MKIPTIIDVSELSNGVNIYKNIPLALTNNHVIRLSVMNEPFYWHYHPNSDETFLGVEGILCIELEDSIIELKPGQLITVQANVKHRSYPKENRSVNLTFELSEIVTIEV